MEDKQFHTVELSTVKQVTVDDILTGRKISAENLDYSLPVHTSSIGIPHQSRNNGLQITRIECGAVGYESITFMSNSEFEQYRGRLGC